MDRVSTVNMHNLTIGSALQVQSQLAAAQVQEASGLAAQDFGTLGGANTNQLLNLETQISEAQTFASNAQTVGNRTQAMYSAIGTMVTMVTQLQSRISQASSAPDNSSLPAAMQNMQQQLASEMNQQMGGSYLFAGSNVSTPPVSLTKYTPAASFDPTAPDTSYYTGDTRTLSVQLSMQQTINYGVNANSPGFEEAMRAVQTVLQASSPTAPTTTNSTLTMAGPTGATDPTSVTAGSFTINGGGPVTVAAGDSLSTIAASINGAAGTTGVTASVVGSASTGYSLKISSGSTAALTFTSGGGTSLTDLGLSNTTHAASFQAALSAGLTTANQAVTDLSNLQSAVADVSKQLADTQQQQTTFVTLLQNSLSNVKDADTAQVASQVQAFQTQLQASYMAVASVSKLSLAQYL